MRVDVVHRSAHITGMAFQTDYIVSPGDYVAEFMEDEGLDTDDITRSAGLPVSDLRSILDGMQPLSAEAAEAIGAATTLRPGFLMRVEALYQEDLKRLFTDQCPMRRPHSGHRYMWFEAAVHWCPGITA